MKSFRPKQMIESMMFVVANDWCEMPPISLTWRCALSRATAMGRNSEAKTQFAIIFEESFSRRDG
jgi:hypothetical protein